MRRRLEVANTLQWGAELMDWHFDPVVLRLIGLLKRALLLTLARTGRIDKLSGGRRESESRPRHGQLRYGSNR